MDGRERERAREMSNGGEGGRENVRAERGRELHEGVTVEAHFLTPSVKYEFLWSGCCSVCVRACACVCVCVSMCACVCVRVFECVSEADYACVGFCFLLVCISKCV